MRLKRAGRTAAVLVAVGAGLTVPVSTADAQASAATTVAWGTTDSAPAGTLGELFGVAAASRQEVLAVGGYNPGKPPTQVLTHPYAELWNGTAWSATPVALGSVYPDQAAGLTGAAAVAPGDTWAVGTVSDLSSLASQTLAYHWNGQAWTRSPTPDPGGATLGNSLAGVASRGARDVWAVGSDGYPAVSLVVHWNGHSWQQVSVPSVGALDAVATAPGRVWVGGGDQVEQFDGTAWSTLPPLPVSGQGSALVTGLAHTSAGLWAAGTLDYSCGEGGTCTSSYAALWNGATWTVTPAGGGTGLSAVTVSGSWVLATAFNGAVFALTPARASAQVTPAEDGLQLTAIAADPAGNQWAVGAMAHQGTTGPAIINAPGIGQGGIMVTTGASGATVTWAGPVTGSGGTDVRGRFAVGGLPDGSYTITASLAGCTPGTATATVTAGQATAVRARITC